MSAPQCPECAQGKTVNCAGQALDLATDELVPCATRRETEPETNQPEEGEHA